MQVSMRTVRAVLWRLRFWRDRERLDRELAEELENHLQMHIDAGLRSGMTPQDARRTALLRSGGIELAKEQYRDRRGLPLLETSLKDLQFAFRMLAKNPAFAAVAILSLALGIGANTAIFSLTDAVLLRTLPVERPREIERIGVMDGPAPFFTFSYPMFREIRRRNQVFRGIFARASVPASLVATGRTERGVVEIVSGNYFSVLGVQAILGRTLTDDDDRVALSSPVAVLSHRYWSERLGANPEIAGKQIHIDGFPFTVVGVAPPAFFGVEVGTAPDIWVPMMMQPQVFGRGHPAFDDSKWGWLDILGRRSPGMGEAQTQAGMNVTFQQITQGGGAGLFWNHPSEIAIHLEPGGRGLSRLRGRFENPLYLLMAVVSVVLLIACANLANLLLARSTARRREVAVRLALGAGRTRLIRQLLTESLVLALCGGFAGYLFSGWSVQLLLRFLPADQSPLTLNVPSDLRLMGFTLLVSIAAAMLFGLAPAIQATRPELAPSLKNEAGSSAPGSRRFGLQGALVILQVALSLMLLVGAGLFLHSLRNAVAIDTGLKTENVLLASMNPQLSGYSPAQTSNFFQQLEARLQGLPGVRFVGFSDQPWLSGHISQVGMQVPGRPDPPGGRSMLLAGVGGDFFNATGIDILSGRGFAAQDTADNPKAAVISQLAALQFFGEEEPIGRTVKLSGQWVQIIGIAADSKYPSVREKTRRIGYLCLAQFSINGERTVYARTAGNPMAQITALREAVRALDKDLPVFNIKTFAEQKSESLVRERLIATLTGFFGAVAVLLAALGLYGVVSYGVERRTREIGIRMSLGAGQVSVVRMVLSDCLLMVTAGIGLGLALSLWLSKLVTSELVGVKPNDPATVVAAAALLMGIGAVAGYFPALRASRVDPMRALRE